jgi:hypothetical protein
LKLNAEDVLDFGALLNWVDIYADVPEEELEILHPPYRVGMMALESVGVSGYFHVGTTLYRMLWEYMPDRFMRMASGGAPEHERPTSILADIGLFMAYQNALAESDAIDAAEATVVEARAEAMERTESFKGIIRSSGVDGLLLRPEDELGLGLPSPDRFYAGSAFEAGELLIASGLFAVPKVRIA